MDIPTVVVNEPDATYINDPTTDEEEESGNNSSCNGGALDFDRNKLHPLAARTRKIVNTTSSRLARQRRLSRSDSTLHRPLVAAGRRGDVDADDGGDSEDEDSGDDDYDNVDDDDDDDDDDSSDDDIPALTNRRNTIDVKPSDVALFKERLERLKRQVSESESEHADHHLNSGGEDSAASAVSRRKKRHSPSAGGVSLPKKTLQMLRAKIGSGKRSLSSSHPDDLDRCLAHGRRHTFGVIPTYAHRPRQKHKVVEENDDALNAAMLRRRPAPARRTSLTAAATAGSLGSRSRSKSRSRKRSSPPPSWRSQGSASSRRTSQSSTKAEVEEELLRLDKQSALLQMMVTEEMER